MNVTATPVETVQHALMESINTHVNVFLAIREFIVKQISTNVRRILAQMVAFALI